MSAPRLVDASTDVGAPELAAALAERDPAQVTRALRDGWVIVATTPGADGAEIRLFGGLDDARQGWELPLFSTTAALQEFLATDARRDFEFVRAASLVGFLEDAQDTIARVVFDPASPHAVAVSVEDVLAVLREPGGEPRPTGHGIAEDDRVLDLELPLGDDWFRIDLTDEEERNDRVTELVDRQLAGVEAGPMLRSQLTQWLRRMMRTADGGRGREAAFLLRRNESAALALSMTRYQLPLGPARGTEHLDALSDRLRGKADHGELVTAQTPTGRLIRQTRQTHGSAELRADEIPVLTVDYWLEFPDRRGLSLVSFSTPHADLRDVVLQLTDEIVLASVWVVAATDTARP